MRPYERAHILEKKKAEKIAKFEEGKKVEINNKN